MAWKDLSYAKRYSLIFGIIHIVVFVALVSFIYLQNHNSSSYQYEPWPAAIIMIIPDAPVFFILDTPLASPVMNIFRSLFGNKEFSLNILLIIFGTIQWLLIGALIGFIVGKIKSRKEKIN